MKILVLYFIVALVSTTLAKTVDKRKTKLRHHPPVEAHRNREPKRSPFPRHITEGLRGHKEKPRIPYVDEGNREEPKLPYVDEGNRRKPNIPHVDKDVRERRPRQSLFTFPVPTSQSGGNHNSGSFQVNPTLTFLNGNQNQGSTGGFEGPPLQFAGNPQGGHPGNQGIGAQPNVPGFQGGNHPGNQGSQIIPGHHSGSSIGNPGGGSIFQSGSFGSSPGTSQGSGIYSSGSSSAVGAGGLNSSPDSGLAGGLGGAYGGGYGFGLGGLVFGGAAGPVFAGNAPIIEGLGTSSDDSENEEDGSDDQDDIPPTPALRPVRPTNNIFYDNNREVKNQKVNNTPSKIPSPPNNNRNAQGETIGYVAFIFPRRALRRPTTPLTDHPRSTAVQKPAHAEAKTKPKSNAKPKVNRLTPIFVPLPVRIPIDRPYPVPVPYEVFKPFPVPVAVEVPKPATDGVPVLLEGQSNLYFQQPSIIHKRSDKVSKPS